MMSLLLEEVSYIYDVIINYSLWRGVNLLRGVCYVYDIIVIYLPLPEECECDTERHVVNTEGDWVTLCHRMLGGGGGGGGDITVTNPLNCLWYIHTSTTHSLSWLLHRSL